MKCAALLNKAYMQYNSATCKITYFYKLRAAADLIGAFCFYSVHARRALFRAAELYF